MSTPAQVTEAHRLLATVCHEHAYSFFVDIEDAEQETEQIKSIAQLIADSEARAITKQIEALAILTLRWDKLEKERDQLRAEVERLKALGSWAHTFIHHTDAERKASVACPLLGVVRGQRHQPSLGVRRMGAAAKMKFAGYYCNATHGKGPCSGTSRTKPDVTKPSDSACGESPHFLHNTKSSHGA